MNIEIIGKHITIGQLLKKEKFVASGGEIKRFLEINTVTINGHKPQGRATKVKINDTLWVNDDLFKVVAK